MEIKEQYIDSIVKCPMTNKPQLLRFLDRGLYDYYFNHGYADFFDIGPIGSCRTRFKKMSFPIVHDDITLTGDSIITKTNR